MKTGSKYFTMFLTAVLLLLILVTIPAAPVPANAALGGDISTAFSEIRQGFVDIKESIEGIGRFFKTLHSIIGAVTTVVDPAALILLLVVLFFSSGFSAIGIPRGRASFTVSLITIDILWFIWKRSMNPESFSFLYSILRANLYIIIPYLSIVVLKIFFRRRFAGTVHSVSGFIRRKILGKKIDREGALLLADKLRGESVSLASSIERDMLTEGKITGVSTASRELMKNLEDTIGQIRSL